MHLKHRPKIVFLDAVHTIMDLYPDLYSVFMRIACKAGWEPDPVVFRQAYDAEYSKVAQRLVGKTDFSIDQTRERDFWRSIDAEIFRRLGLGHCCEDLAEEFFNEFETGIHWQLFDETLPTIEALRRMGCRVAIISNGTEGMHHYMHRCELKDLVDFALVSAVVGWEKPGREIFEIALRRAAVPSSDAIHVGDSYDHDVIGARAAGITPIWIKHNRDLPEDHCVSINSIGELPDLLESLPERN